MLVLFFVSLGLDDLLQFFSHLKHPVVLCLHMYDVQHTVEHILYTETLAERTCPLHLLQRLLHLGLRHFILVLHLHPHKLQLFQQFFLRLRKAELDR